MKPLHLLPALLLFSISIYSQKTDTLRIFYATDEYQVSKEQKQQMDSFLKMKWDRISINGYTDEVDSDDYNLELSKKRSQKVYQYFLGNKVDPSILFTDYFGENSPFADNASEEGKAMNRRTEIIGYQFPMITIKEMPDPQKPVTKTLDNGFIVTYCPDCVPGWMANSFTAGTGIDFQLITNTTQMRQNNFYNNTTNGEILSSVLIICGRNLKPCKLTRPIEMKIPIPYKTKCPIEKVKFFNAVAERGKMIWQEQNKEIFPEIIDGRQYVKIYLDNLCECINFDFKIDPDCFDTDSTKLLYVNTNIKNVVTELVGLNSVYSPKKINDTTYSILYLKDELDNALVSFTLYNGKRFIKTFRHEKLKDLDAYGNKDQFIIQIDSLKLYFQKLRVNNVVLKVNNDKYKVTATKRKFDFFYLKRPEENISIDFTIMESRGRVQKFKDIPLAALNFDSKKGYHLIDKKYYKVLKESQSISKN